MGIWRSNGDGTVSFESSYGTVTINEEFLNNSYIGADVSDITGNHPNYHEYETTYNLGYSTGQVDLETVQNALAAHPTPTAGELRGTGGYNVIGSAFAGPGVVTTHWPNAYTNVNVTTDLHALDPGLVHREIVIIDGQYYIRTVGIGIGVFPQANINLAGGVWGMSDVRLAQVIWNETGIRPTNPGHISINGEVFNNQCFLEDTSVQMWPLDPSIKPRLDGSYDEELVQAKIWYKRQDQMQAGDFVVSYDKQGRLQPGRVSRTMTNTSTHILDFWDTGVTPGHVYNCADGPFKDSFAPLMDILRMDGALMHQI